ncbi:MAG TPA: class I SAM-dependent methyltransferase [Syntrophomonadaceae bacterium]|nr:class I SAM-dependent methyltransferase [Syntrophomonadaceae bacterium]
MEQHIEVTPYTKILDLACGKGAVSINLARAFGCKVKGIDLIPEFIDYAVNKAIAYGLQDRCKFTVEDINQSVLKENGYDIVILASVGDVLGNVLETLLKLKNTVRPRGYILIDDAYSKDGSNNGYHTRELWLRSFTDAGVRLIAEKTAEARVLKDINKYNQERIFQRAHELMKSYPDLVDLFAEYIESQQAECDELEGGNIISVTWLLQKDY